MYDIPQSIVIEGQTFNIRNKGDFRTILDCFGALEDIELTDEERNLASLIIFYEDLNGLEDIDKLPNLESALLEMYKFFNCGELESPGASVNYKLIDWQKDSQLVCSAINNVAGQEIRALPYVHWWTFMGYYLAVGESPLATVLSIRGKIKKGEKLEKWEQKFRQNNPNYFNWDSRTTKEKELDDEVNKLWNAGK